MPFYGGPIYKATAAVTKSLSNLENVKQDLCTGWIKRCSINSAHCVTLTNIFSWNFLANLNRDATQRDQKWNISSFHGLVRWFAPLQTIYKVREMLRVSTRHKIFHFLTEGAVRTQEPRGHPVTTFPKDVHPQEWQWKPGSKPLLTILFGCFTIQAISDISLPGLWAPPQLGRIQAHTLSLSSPLRIIYRMPTDTVQTRMKWMIVCISRHAPVVK